MTLLTESFLRKLNVRSLLIRRSCLRQYLHILESKLTDSSSRLWSWGNWVIWAITVLLLKTQDLDNWFYICERGSRSAIIVGAWVRGKFASRRQVNQSFWYPEFWSFKFDRLVHLGGLRNYDALWVNTVISLRESGLLCLLTNQYFFDIRRFHLV